FRFTGRSTKRCTRSNGGDKEIETAFPFRGDYRLRSRLKPQYNAPRERTSFPAAARRSARDRRTQAPENGAAGTGRRGQHADRARGDAAPGPGARAAALD